MANLQEKQLRACMKSFRPNVVVSIIDFVENPSFTMQFMHWFSSHVIIFVHITYGHNPNVDPSNEEFKNLNNNHLHVSDAKKHDSYFEQHGLLFHWNYLVS